MAITYGSFEFPSPSPIVAIGDSPIYVAGELDRSLTKITLVGQITGSNLSGLAVKKNSIITGLLSQFETLDVEGEEFLCARPVSLSFSESDLTTFLPYSAEFESYDEKSFSQYFGVVNPSDVWTFQEQQNRVVQATHTVSANGIKTGAGDPLVTARNFVNGNLNGFENLSFVNPSGVAFLTSKTEEVNRFNNSYSVTENYSFSTSREPISNSGLISATTQISYTKGSEGSININGSILGDLTGARITTGLFTANDARNLAINAVERSRSSYESGIYGVLSSGPSSYSYTVKEDANQIDFSFQFRDPFNVRTGDVFHDYTVSVSASKGNNTLTAAIDGTLTYDAAFDIFTGGSIELAPRYVKILAEFENLNLYALAAEKYGEFIDVVSGYETSKYLNPIPRTESVTKSPFIPSISYSYSYDNKVDFSSGQLKDLTFSIQDTLPIAKTEIKESNNGFASQETVLRTLGRLSINASCSESADKLPILQGIVSGFLSGKNCQIFEEGLSTGDSSISYNLGSYY